MGLMPGPHDWYREQAERERQHEIYEQLKKDYEAEKAKLEALTKPKPNRIEFERPDKVDVNLAIACLISSVTTDAQTQCGCVITTKTGRILGAGYNGYPREIDNSKLPNLRPEKYLWFNPNHAERNAVTNCTMKPELVGGGIAYVTGDCCFDCTVHLWNNHVDTIYELQGFNAPAMCVNSTFEQDKADLVERLEGKLKIIKVEMDFTKNAKFRNTLFTMGFVPKENK